MDQVTLSNKSKALKLFRCMEWLQKQNGNARTATSASGKKNDLKYIIQTNADKKKFLLSVIDDDATVPVGVDEQPVKPNLVPVQRLRLDSLQLECEWQKCKYVSSDYEIFQKHVEKHMSNVQTVQTESGVECTCLWDVCGFKTLNFKEMVRHINYHAYHARLLATGLNGRATLKLDQCKKDSTKRNHIPLLPTDHVCLWTGCNEKFNSIQIFLDHVKLHAHWRSKNFVCSWAGCGLKFKKRAYLNTHVRTHTRERLIACYHCGMHFFNNTKLLDHIRRQNVAADSPYECTMCGTKCATQYLLNEHARQHVSAFLCALCDMSAPSKAALALHVLYRHVPPSASRVHACTHCKYRAVTKSDLRRHVVGVHEKKRKLSKEYEENDECELKKDKKKAVRKYACHLCPEKQMKIFLKGARLTKHLVKVHGARWPFGHSRFRYQISEDGMYRVTTTRYEVLEVSKKIVDRANKPKETLTNKYEFNIEQTSEPTKYTPRRFNITFKNEPGEEIEEKPEVKSIEIIMCDVDEDGNVIKTQIMN